MYVGRHLDTSGPFTITAKTYGPWFWVSMSYNYLLMLGAVLLLIARLFQSPRLYRGQSVALLVSIIVPLAWNVIYVADLTDLYRVDLMPSAFVISGLAIAWGLFRLRLLDVLPLAQSTVVDRMRDGVLVLDPEDRVVGLNRTFESVAGCTSQEAFGQPATRLLSEHPRLAELLRQTAGTAESATEVSIEADGERRHFETSLVPLTVGDGHTAGRLLILHDATERLQAEQELRQLYADEREARQELEAEKEKRIEFTRALVHELKTPITPVLAAAELLLQRIEDGPSMKLIASIARSASNLNRRIDDLMDLIKSETDMLSLDYRTVDVASLLEDLGQEMTPVAEAAGHRLVVDVPSDSPLVQADSDRLRQVVQNLLNNAVKFAPAGGTITLSMAANAGGLVVQVHDTGHGMTQAELERLFDPYFRRAVDRERLGGLGLGLALSKRLVELHGGEMWVTSERDEGTTFGFSLPLQPTTADEV
jgi:PAS domain S-box-containing protein